MTAADLLDECKRSGIELTAASGRVRYRAPGRLGPELAARLAENKAAILAALTTTCPTCSRPVDAKRQCWGCHDRACAGCGRPTGSAFIALCNPCGRIDSQTSVGS